jgi:2-keto-4-pentenoate hydratase/2-oxohepta-3-ene-1,7-dioic acid hydratase in catechol pathway
VERFVRFYTSNDPTRRWGVRDGDDVVALTAAPWDATSQRTQARHRDVLLAAPATPTKIIALGYNYKELFADPAARANSREAHFTDPGFEPLVFLKGPNCVADPGAVIALRGDVSDVWVEVEIAAVIGRRARNLPGADAARDAVFGLTIGNDITALNVLGRDWHLARSKSLDGFCPVGPEIVRGLDETALLLRTEINGRETQRSTTADRVLDTYASVALVSRMMTLEPGDVVLTGTPRGGRQSVVHPGDRVDLSIEHIGTLSSTFVAEVA